MLGNKPLVDQVDLPSEYLMAIDECRAKVGVQKAALDKEVAAIVARQTAKESGHDRNITSLLESHADEKKGLQRGPVGCDGVG